MTKCLPSSDASMAVSNCDPFGLAGKSLYENAPTMLYICLSKGNENLPSPCADQMPNVDPSNDESMGELLGRIFTDVNLHSNLFEALKSIFGF